MMLRFAIIFMIALSLAFTTAATYAYGAPASSVIADERKTARINDLTPLSQPILMIVPPRPFYYRKIRDDSCGIQDSSTAGIDKASWNSGADQKTRTQSPLSARGGR